MLRQGRVTLLVTFMLLLAFGCAKREVPPARIAIEDNYSAVRLLPFSVSAGVSADSYQWVVDSVEVTENANTLLAKESAAMRGVTVSTEETLHYTFDAVGVYYMMCRMRVGKSDLVKSFKVHVVSEFQSYKVQALLVDYRPALGQTVTEAAKNAVWGLQETMRRANLNIRRGSNAPIYLGSFGGYATFKFDHSVRNFSNKYDFEVVRDLESQDYGRADVVVWVSQDEKQWYRLRSEYDSVAYSGVYAKGPGNLSTEGDKTFFYSDDKYLWKTDRGVVNIPVKKGVTVNYLEILPKWIESDLGTPYEGYLLKRQCRVKLNYDNAVPPNLLSYELVEFPKRKYNEPPVGEQENVFGMDIDWAVDEQGNAVQLQSIKFVKVATGVLEAPPTFHLLESSVVVVRDLNME